MPSLMVLPPP
ncbi:hypothetical protein F383_28015 [Gossypium arboreum]|uniref:Uncharacterized protein n=1 Tax=Gossypium arboreum TaxID=29729 RepID=A0A0B0MI47_GOSAR|nr:hypothetical protein F383_19057 [Gossypium arboreum]KHG11472.1 hypothetical protein F383_16383 [Gossypium arboreum]KHG20841.1 hypothetical protein F383_28015 [Gossypium arboreum]